MIMHENAAPDTDPTVPTILDRATFDAELDALQIRENAHTREGDAIAGARRLPMVEVPADAALLGTDRPATLLDAFEESRQLIVYYLCGGPDATAPTFTVLSHIHISLGTTRLSARRLSQELQRAALLRLEFLIRYPDQSVSRNIRTLPSASAET